MASDDELVDRLRAFLSTSDLDQTTTAIVRRKLEEDFGIDLSAKKAFIRDQVDLYLQEIRGNEEGEEEEEQQEQEESGVVEAEEEHESEEDGEPEEAIEDEKRPAKRRSKKNNEEVKKKRGGGFTKVCTLSPQLQKFTGVPELARTEVVKQIWSYIREKNLQDPADMRNIVCDDALRELFEVDTINMFQMNKALARHIWPLGSSEAPAASAPKEKPKKQDRKKDREEEPDDRKGKKQKGGNSAFLASLPLSDALIKFLDTGENALPRSDVIKRVWDYIKLNNLQDPSDRRMILCDEKLKELFDVDTFQGFTVSKLLKDHFIKPDQ